MALNDRIYIVVPRTVDSKRPPYKVAMTCGRMAGHVGHVSGELQRASGVDVAAEYLIVLSVANSQELDGLCRALEKENVSFVEYRDPDEPFYGELLSAIATWPVQKYSSPSIIDLLPWRCKCNEVLNHSSGSSDSQHRAPGSNREVAGAIPAPSSKGAG